MVFQMEAVSWESVRNADSQPHLRRTKSETVVMWPRNLYRFTMLSRWLSLRSTVLTNLRQWIPPLSLSNAKSQTASPRTTKSEALAWGIVWGQTTISPVLFSLEWVTQTSPQLRGQELSSAIWKGNMKEFEDIFVKLPQTLNSET